MRGRGVESRINFIKKFLEENPKLSHTAASKIVTLAGYACQPRTIMEYRTKFGIEFTDRRVKKLQLKEDMEAGMTFRTPEELITRYNMSRVYALRVFREMHNGELTFGERRKPIAEQPVRVELPPMRVGSMEHMISQLTAR